MKWKIFAGVLTWIALVGIIHYTRICWLKESPNWNESSPGDSIRSYVFSFAMILSYPGLLVSTCLPLLRRLPMDLNGFNVFAEIFDDIFYALLIALIIWKFPPKPKKL
jgi:hypothetical protein